MLPQFMIVGMAHKHSSSIELMKAHVPLSTDESAEDETLADSGRTVFESGSG
jgi:hypothetical protein